MATFPVPRWKAAGCPAGATAARTATTSRALQKTSPCAGTSRHGETGIRTRDTTIFSNNSFSPKNGRFAGYSLDVAPRTYRWFPRDSWGFGPGGGHPRPKPRSVQIGGRPPTAPATPSKLDTQSGQHSLAIPDRDHRRHLDRRCRRPDRSRSHRFRLDVRRRCPGRRLGYRRQRPHRLRSLRPPDPRPPCTQSHAGAEFRVQTAADQPGRNADMSSFAGQARGGDRAAMRGIGRNRGLTTAS
jgi:hypothetical protein